MMLVLLSLLVGQPTEKPKKNPLFEKLIIESVCQDRGVRYENCMCIIKEVLDHAEPLPLIPKEDAKKIRVKCLHLRA